MANRSASTTIKDVIDYAINSSKTDDGKLVSTHGCTSWTAHDQFLRTKAEYHSNGGRNMPKDRDRLVYHLVQSFKPNEINPDEANRIGYELAMRFTDGKHAFVVGTHIDTIDKGHGRGAIHNHIVFSAVDTNGKNKYADKNHPVFQLRRQSDRLCLENGLSIIESPRQASSSRKHHAEITASRRKKKPDARNVLRSNIVNALANRPKDFNAFLATLKSDYGWNNHRRGKNLTMTHKDFNENIRLWGKLGEGFSETDIKKIIDTKQFPKPLLKNETPRAEPSQSTPKPQNLLQQMQVVIQSQLAVGHKDLEAIDTLSFLVFKRITSLKMLDKRLHSIQESFDTTGEKLRNIDKQIERIDALSYEIKNYNNGSKLHAKYNELAKNNPQAAKQFYEANRASLMPHQAARKYFEMHGYGKSKGKPVPSLDDLKSEKLSLQKRKTNLSSEYEKFSLQHKELQKAREASRSLLQEKSQDLPRQNIEIDIPTH